MTISLSSSKNSGVPVCELRGVRGPIFLAVNDTPQAARRSPLCFNEVKAALSRFGNRKLIKKWLLPVVESSVGTGVPVPSITNLTTLMLTSSFLEGKDTKQWADASLIMENWMDGPMSLATWTDREKTARQSMLDALKCSKSSIVQRILECAAGVCQDITKQGYFVYVLVSPLWGKCYVGGCGYGRARCPLRRYIEHLRMAKFWSSKTSTTRYCNRRPPHYAAITAVSPCNVAMILVSNTSAALLSNAERFYTRKLHPVFNVRNVDDIRLERQGTSKQWLLTMWSWWLIACHGGTILS